MSKNNSFESKILELEELVRKLEEGEVTLEESKKICTNFINQIIQ